MTEERVSRNSDVKQIDILSRLIPLHGTNDTCFQPEMNPLSMPTFKRQLKEGTRESHAVENKVSFENRCNKILGLTLLETF